MYFIRNRVTGFIFTKGETQNAVVLNPVMQNTTVKTARDRAAVLTCKSSLQQMRTQRWTSQALFQHIEACNPESPLQESCPLDIDLPNSAIWTSSGQITNYKHTKYYYRNDRIYENNRHINKTVPSWKASKYDQQQEIPYKDWNYKCPTPKI